VQEDKQLQKRKQVLMRVKYTLPLWHQQIWCIHSWQWKACWANSACGI